MIKDATKLHQTLLRHLPELDLAYGARAPLLHADVDTDSTLDWWVRGTLGIAREMREDGLHWPQMDGVSLDEAEEEEDGTVHLAVFAMSGFIVNTYEVTDLADTLDARSADAAHFLPLVDMTTGDLADAAQGFGIGPNLLIIDRVQIAPAWRGAGGIGRLLIAAALRWLTHDASVVAVHPYPFTLAEDPAAHPRFAEALTAVRHTWADLGFAPLPEHHDLWVLDPSSNALTAAEQRLRRSLLGVGRG